MENNIGYIQIPSFDETTSSEFKTKFEELQKQNIKSLVIDMIMNYQLLLQLDIIKSN